ncbi:MAG: GFA family protein [Burkholderiales bacterium]
MSATVRGDPVRVSVCHCLACQRRTGSVFGAQARFPRDAATVEGVASEFVRRGDSGTSETCFRFCPRCGATVYYTFDAAPEWIAIPVGAFADPAFPPPTISVYEARRHAWASVPGDAEHLD